ncbi:hypothetical protein BGX24_007146 [Mortierella sp. AD032]|nr:hypothetical protein BGX24_007146 [Mortierella sp. AD032]
MSCESCTGCFEATPCSAPSPSLHGNISKEYRRFLRAAHVCEGLVADQHIIAVGNTSASTPATFTAISEDDIIGSGASESSNSNNTKVDHAFNTLIGVLANSQFTAQTYLSMAYRQLGPRAFLQMSRRLAQHEFWGRLVTWAFLFAGEDSGRLHMLVEQQDQGLLQRVNDEAEMLEVFNPAVKCGRVVWREE